jgi:hypothetical protein
MNKINNYVLILSLLLAYHENKTKPLRKAETLINSFNVARYFQLRQEIAFRRRVSVL